MKTYIGKKTIMAKPMTRLEYNKYRNWELPEDEDGNDDGMLVEYIDGGKSNHPNHSGYISWSPLDVFEKAYKPANDYKERLQIEHDELNEKMVALKEAVENKQVPESAVAILIEQYHAMEEYLDILKIRLK